MKSSTSCLAALLVLGGTVSFAQADNFLFDENFDQDPPYADNADLPHGYGKGGVLHGRWILSPNDDGTAQTTPEYYASAPRSLRLNVPDSATRMNVQGAFAGEDKAKRISVPGAITLKCAFRLENTGGNTKGAFGVQIWGNVTEDKPAQVRIHKNGRPVVEANFAGEWVDIPAEIEPDKFYRLEIAMPENPANAEAEYTVKLYGAEGKIELGSAHGKLAVASTGNEYMYFALGNSMPGASVYVDDVTVACAE